MGYIPAIPDNHAVRDGKGKGLSVTEHHGKEEIGRFSRLTSASASIDGNYCNICAALRIAPKDREHQPYGQNARDSPPDPDCSCVGLRRRLCQVSGLRPSDLERNVASHVDTSETKAQCV